MKTTMIVLTVMKSLNLFGIISSQLVKLLRAKDLHLSKQSMVKNMHLILMDRCYLVG